MADVKIVMTAHGRGEVFIDGARVPGVCAVSFSAGVGSRNEVRITVLASSASIEGPAYVENLSRPWWRRVINNIIRAANEELPSGSKPPL